MGGGTRAPLASGWGMLSSSVRGRLRSADAVVTLAFARGGSTARDEPQQPEKERRTTQPEDDAHDRGGAGPVHSVTDDGATQRPVVHTDVDVAMLLRPIHHAQRRDDSGPELHEHEEDPVEPPRTQQVPRSPTTH